jgi:hypothetical protein
MRDLLEKGERRVVVVREGERDPNMKNTFYE